jgi:hypothetical protein
MNVEQRLRDAMDARVRNVGAPSLPARPVRPSRKWSGAVIAFAAVLVVMFLVVILRGDSQDREPRASSGRYPSRIVAVTYGGRLVVLDSRSGSVIRTLARDAVAEDGVGGASVTPDGERVYFSRRTGSKCDEIASVSTRGGPVHAVVAGARWPAVSPDGRYLAYSGAPTCSDAGRTIVLKSLVAGVPDRRFDTVNVPSGTPGTVRGLAWAPDSRHLVFVREIGSTSPYVLDVDTAEAVDDAQRVLIGDGSSVSGFLGRSDVLLGAVVPGGDHPEDFELWAVDAATGARTRRLFTLPIGCCGQEYTADTSGRNVLVTGAHLYRWTQGHRRAVPIADRIAVATWVSEAGAPAAKR